METVQIDLNEVLPDGSYVLLPSEAPTGDIGVGDKFRVEDFDGSVYEAVVAEVHVDRSLLLWVDAGLPAQNESGRRVGVLH